MRNRFFNLIAHIVSVHPKKIIVSALILAIAAGGYAALTLTLNANLDDLVSEKLDYHRNYKEFLKEFGDEEYLYVVADASKNIGQARKFIETLGEKLTGQPDIKEVVWKVDNPALEQNFLLYLTPEQLASLDAMTTGGAFSVKNIANWTTLTPLFGAMADQMEAPISKSDEISLSTGFTFIDGLLGDMATALSTGGPYKSRLQELFFGDGENFDTEGFYRNGDLLFLLIMPNKDFTTMEVIAEPLARIRSTIDEVQKEFPDIDAGLTGRPVLSADEISTSDKDMTRATIIAIVLVGLLFIMFFRSVTRPILSMVSLIMGISWTFGLIAIIFGELNILSIVFALILVGAAIEYAIHLVARYQEELAGDGMVEQSMARALNTSGRADLTSAFTTAAAFLTIMWTDFTAIAQLGFIAASGIILCLIAMLVVLPAMIVLSDRRRSPDILKNVRPFTMPRISALYHRPVAMFIVALIATIIIMPFASKTGFDNNLLNLQAKGLESVEYEHLIIEKSNETTWFARAVAETEEESHKKAELFRSLPSVSKVDDVERILPRDQKKKIAEVRKLTPSFDGLTFKMPSDRVNAAALKAVLGRIAGDIEGLQAKAFSGGRVDAVEELGKFDEKVRLVESLIAGADTAAIKRLGAFQEQFLIDLHGNMSILATGLNPEGVKLSDLPENVRRRFISPKGRYSLYIYPKENIWDPAALAKFVEDIRGADEGVVGTPIEVHESGRLMRDTFKRSAIMAFIVICLLVLVDFKSWKLGLLAVMPLVTGLAWLVGGMGLFGIPFNMANFFAVPILIGIGVDFGVHLVHRIQRDGVEAAMASSTGKGVLLTAVANAVGFGAMMMAAHRGIASLGQIMALGSLCCLAAAMFAMPPIAGWLLRRGNGK